MEVKVGFWNLAAIYMEATMVKHHIFIGDTLSAVSQSYARDKSQEQGFRWLATSSVTPTNMCSPLPWSI